MSIMVAVAESIYIFRVKFGDHGKNVTVIRVGKNYVFNHYFQQNSKMILKLREFSVFPKAFLAFSDTCWDFLTFLDPGKSVENLPSF